jgi:hypothetical protein
MPAADPVRAYLEDLIANATDCLARLPSPGAPGRRAAVGRILDALAAFVGDAMLAEGELGIIGQEDAAYTAPGDAPGRDSESGFGLP